MLLLLETVLLDYLVHDLPGAPPERAAPPLRRGRPVRGLGEAPGGRGLGEHALLGPLPLGLHEARARQAQHRLPRGEGLHDPVAALDLAVGALLDVVGAELGPVRPGEGRERQRGVLGLLEDLAGPGGHRRHPGRRLGPHAAREVGVVLVDRGVHEVPDGRLGALGPARAGALEVALQVRHAALPGAALEQARDGGHEPGVAVGDHEAHAGQPALAQPAEECRPGVLALGVDHVAAQEVLAPVGAQPDRGHDALRDDRRADPAAHVGGVEPQVAARRARQVAAAELRHLGVEVGAESRDLRARQRGYAQPGRHALDLAGGHAAHVHLLHDGGHRGVDARPAREHALGVVGAVPELGYLELHVAHGGLERPGAVAVAAVPPAVAALVAARAAHLLGLGVHQRVHHAAQHPARELARISALPPEPRRLEGLVAAEAQYTLFLGHRLSFHSSPSLLQRRILGGVPFLSRKGRGGACPASYTTSLRATAMVNLPHDIAGLVEQTYSRSVAAEELCDAGAAPEWVHALRSAEEELEKTKEDKQLKANAWLLSKPQKGTQSLIGWLNETFSLADETKARAAVRDSGDTVEVIAVQVSNDGFTLLPWVTDIKGGRPCQGYLGDGSEAPDDEVARLAASCTVSLPFWLSSEQVIDALEIKSQALRWQESRWLQGQLVLAFDSNLDTVIETKDAIYRMHYSRKAGLELVGTVRKKGDAQ